MKQFLQTILPDLKKDLFKDGVKYIVTFIFGFLGIWAAKQIGFLNMLLKKDFTLSFYNIFLICFLTALTASFITYLLYNIKYQKLRKDSLVDELTGLLNHKAFPHELKESMDGAKRDKKPLSVIFFDIDNFKMINEQYLMQGGDDIMRQIGAYLSRDSRASDITCRQHLKGDEFIIIARGTTKDQARMAAERKRNEIQNLGFQVNQNQIIKITMSAGIAEFEWEKDNIDSLINKANKALITAKNNGKNCSIIYNQ